MLLENKVAIVTGSAGGIGRGIALKFAQEGCDVAVVDLNLKGANETLDEVKKLGREGLAFEADITNSSQIKAMVDKVIEKFGRIDILVNSAGTLFSVADQDKRSITLIPEEQWDRIVDINLKGCFICCKYVTPHMMEKGYGKIVNFSSLGAIHPPAVCPHYNAAKAGVLALTLDMATELGPYNITVNSILPGAIRTPFYDPLLENMSEEAREARFANLCKGAPLQRMGTPEDVAGVALFLSSELSAYVTGVQILVSGGQPLMSKV